MGILRVCEDGAVKQPARLPRGRGRLRPPWVCAVRTPPYEIEVLRDASRASPFGITSDAQLRNAPIRRLPRHNTYPQLELRKVVLVCVWIRWQKSGTMAGHAGL